MIRPYTRLEKYLEKSNYFIYLKKLEDLYESIPFFVYKRIEQTDSFQEYKQTYIKWRSQNYPSKLNETYILSKLKDSKIKTYFDSFNNI